MTEGHATRGSSPNKIYLKDYEPPSYAIPSVYLCFEIENAQTRVTSRLEVERAAHAADGAPFILYGRDLEPEAIKLNGVLLTADQYIRSGEELRIPGVPSTFELEVETSISPANNKSGMGLYKSDEVFVTQMEPEGFRRVTFYPDRPDVMARFTTKIIGDKKTCPVLLANGNLIDSGDLENGKHYAVWEDPFPKPSCCRPTRRS